jgi:hypothetical protein
MIRFGMMVMHPERATVTERRGRKVEGLKLAVGKSVGMPDYRRVPQLSANCLARVRQFSFPVTHNDPLLKSHQPAEQSAG